MNLGTLPKSLIRVDVDFYNDVECKKLLAFPTASTMKALVESPIEIPTSEFLTYFLFHKKRLGTPGFRDYQTIGNKISQALDSLDESIIFNDHSIARSQDVISQLPSISEHVGEAVGLAVAGRIHNLTEADWGIILPKGGRKAMPAFDYQIASDGENFVQVENKGSSVEDNRLQDAKIKAQYGKILDKKSKLGAIPDGKVDPYPASLRYGTIVAVDSRKDGNVKCWLTDPPPDLIPDEPRRFRLLQRMRFLRDWISLIGPRSPFSSALSTRVADLEAIEDPFVLDGVGLRRGNNEAFEFGVSKGFGSEANFFVSKSQLVDGTAGGLLAKINDRELMFFGIHSDLVANAAKQDFKTVLEYRAPAYTAKRAVKCVLRERVYRSFRLPESIVKNTSQSSGYFSFYLDGPVHHSSSGLVFGFLELPAN